MLFCRRIVVAQRKRTLGSWLRGLSTTQALPPPAANSPPESTLHRELEALRRSAIRFRVITLALLAAIAGVSSYFFGSMLRRLAPAADVRDFRPVRIAVSHEWILGVVLIGLAVIIAIRLIRWNYLSRRYRQEPPDLESFSVTDVPDETWLPPVPRDIAARMRRREQFEDEELDIAATVEACASNAGIFTPVYQKRTRVPEYLVLIDRAHPEHLPRRSRLRYRQATQTGRGLQRGLLLRQRPRKLVSAEEKRAMHSRETGGALPAAPLGGLRRRNELRQSFYRLCPRLGFAL